MPDWHLYIARCADGSLYTGISTDVARRTIEHRGGGSRSARYVRSRTLIEVVFSTVIGERSAALVAEAAVKSLDKARKEALAAGRLSLAEVLAARRARKRSRRSLQRDGADDPARG